MKKVSVGKLFVLNTYWIGLSFMWNSLHPIILPALLLNFAPEALKNTYLGLLTFAGLIIALLVQPISGAISDRFSSRWGKRRPFIFGGTLFDLVFLSLLAWSGGFIWVVIGYIGLQFSSNVAHGPMQGLMPDRVSKEQLGTGSGIKNLMDMGGMIIASLLAGRLLDPEARYPFLIMIVVMSILVVSMLVTVLGTHEEASPAKPENMPRFSIKDFTQINFAAHKDFWWLIAMRFVILLGIYGIQSFVQYYLRDVLKFANPAQAAGDILAAIAIMLVLCSVLGGWLCDRISEKKVMVLAALLTAAGSLLLLLAHTSTTLIIFGSVFGAGIGLFLTSNWALANRLAPAEEAGKFLGLTNLATAGSGALGRLEGPLIDLLNGAFPGAFVGYYGLFVLGAVCALLSILFLRYVNTQPKSAAVLAKAGE